MQKQNGIVLASSSGEAQVRIVQHSACASCGKCSMAHEQRTRVVKAQNLIAAQPGDRVVLAMSQQAVLRAGLLAYTLPLLVMFIGAFLGQYLAGQIGSVVGGFAALALSYLTLNRIMEPRIQRSSQFTITITEIIDNEEADVCVTEHDNAHY